MSKYYQWSYTSVSRSSYWTTNKSRWTGNKRRTPWEASHSCYPTTNGWKPECPHCHGDQIKRHGKMGSMQRYRCKSCSKTFNDTTKTPMSGLHHKGKWFDYFACMIEGKTLRESARACGIDLKTSCRWRHRFLEVPALLKDLSLQAIVRWLGC